MNNTLRWDNTELLRELEARIGTRVNACLQCHKCSTGCPVGPESDYSSSQVMRLIHLGEEAEVLGSRAIWLCASCEACTTRCPMGIDIAGVMDTLRIMALERKVAIGDTHGKNFNRSFLASVRRHGRVYEMGMMAGYKLRSGALFADTGKFPLMLAKGKLPLVSRKSGSAKEVREVFKRADEEEARR